MNQNKGGRPKTFPDITEDEYKNFRNVSRRVRKRDQTGSYKKKLERLQKNGDLQNFRQTDAERNKVYITKKLEIKRSQEALMMQDKIQTRGIMETVENLCVLTPDKRKRLVESQSTPVEIAASACCEFKEISAGHFPGGEIALHHKCERNFFFLAHADEL